MELDTGSAVSIIPHDLYMETFNDKTLHKTELMLKTFAGENIISVGVLKANVEYKATATIAVGSDMWLRTRPLC